MVRVRAGLGLALLLLASCGETSTPASVRASLSSCDVMADCTQPPAGGCFSVQCIGHVCTPTLACGGGCSNQDAKCNDANPCTTDACVSNACVNTPLVGGGCCVVVGNCAAANGCQTASCVQSSCTYVSNGGAGCCNVTADCSGTAVCTANTCVCGSGKYCPGVGCVAVGGCCSAADCDSTRSNGPSCTAGNCTYTGCKAGFGDCVTTAPNLAGCETDLTTSTLNCGACGQACTPTNATSPVCSASHCSYTCNAGFGDCDTSGANLNGCETDIATSVANCGGCGRACSSTQTGVISCGGGLCTSSCVVGFGNCTRPAAPTADNGCESNLGTDPGNCGACGTSCAAPTNACQLRSCANPVCGYVSTGGAGCCNTVGQCSANACQIASCMSNVCVFTGKTGVAGCCNQPQDCPAQTDPCKTNTCINHQCVATGFVCSDAGADLAVVDMTPPEDLAQPPDLAVPDLAVSVDASPDLSLLSLTGGGGCSFGGDAAGPGALLVVLLVVLMRRRRA